MTSKRSKSRKRRVISEEHKRKISEANKGRILSEETRHKMSIAKKNMSVETKRKISENNVGMKGKKHSEEAKRKQSENHVGMTGKKHSEEAKRKQRLSTMARIERRVGQVQPNYNPIACHIIEEYGKQHGFNFQHAENDGEFHVKELGYWVDGYDAKQNVVIEVDEAAHYRNGKLKKKDVERQREITEHLGCNFIRIRV